MEPEELLFTGTRTQLQNVIYNGLDHDYSARSLLRLMQEDQPAAWVRPGRGVPQALVDTVEKNKQTN